MAIKKKVQEEIKTYSPWFDDMLAVIVFAVGLFFALALLSYYSVSLHSAMDVSIKELASRNMMGPLGHFVSVILNGIFGYSALVLPSFCFWMAYVFLRRAKEDPEYPIRTFSFALIWLITATLAYTYYSISGGGEIGRLLGEPLVTSFNRSGAVLFQLTALAILLAHVSNFTLSEIIYAGFKTIVWTFPCFCFVILCKFLKKKEQNIIPERETIVKTQSRQKETVIYDGYEADEDEYHEVVVRRADKKTRYKPKKRKSRDTLKDYTAPDIDLLMPPGNEVMQEEDSILLDKSRLIEEKLRDFNISGKITEVHPGPVITMFEFEPAAGVKVGKIASLQDDLAMSLKASAIRIIAPIPNKGTVGIEVPNQARDIVRLREVLESPAYMESSSELSIALGKNIYGEPVAVDIASMPHLLMAGATGAGKSVCINTVLLSMLFRCSPADLGLILIDPKILELSVYDGIPHLRAPVVTVPKQAKAVLEWAVREMDRRYRMMQKHGVRSIEGYNRLVKGSDSSPILEQGVVSLKPENIISESSGTISTEKKGEVEFKEEMETLPKIVIVIDEMADLMLSVGRDIEDLVARLAQKARAAGIHLILATQRPSVDVITGLIKANFPARISFRVSSRIDSRTILDSMGAERLLGKGDMLMQMPGAHHLQRVHGAFVSDSEVNAVIAQLKENSEPQYDDEIMDYCARAMEEDSKNPAEGDIEYDELYDQTVELIMDKGQASTSMIQRAFRIGYNRAARIMDTLEREGIIGPMDGAKPREVLLQSDASSM